LDLETSADRLLAELPGHRRQSVTLAREAGVSLVMMAMEAGDAINEHSAPGVVTVHVLRGQAAVTAGDEEAELRSGELVMLQPGVRHDVRAAEQAVVLLTITGGEAR
jgi:quercetin dioxygenase-like cupin family protein